MAGSRSAIARGVDAIEVDVQATSDGVPVLMHDCSLHRAIGDPRSIEDLTADEATASPGTSDGKQASLRLNHEVLAPNRVESGLAAGITLVIARRDGYRIWDMDGAELQDFHLNGGTYNLGHRHPELLAAMREALETLDVGNHHFPSEARGVFAEKLARNTPGDLHYGVLTPSGSEANDVALK